MSFSEHLENYIKQRDQQQQQGQPLRHKYVVQDPTNQSLAREAMAQAQEDASRQATVESKQPHYRVNGRCMTQNEASAMEQLKPTSAPANPDRIAYIQQLRKNLKLRKPS
ncbi:MULTISPECIES: hypothetical protein [Photobacterium]|uniref:Uncharacterized protein n=1 Tax=Photobacterium ganghwense TaxID=320778 RepID=A0A0J1HAT0_9GAMM|nr:MULTISPECIES: hypothetical protein [Photobacterium]KLV08744.1 hypothetical protein ABT57_13105 [Photobacterium ganghwense]MBV1841171.1 hypothetical protein [Photobacterium ganghwense]PSU10869.1 hypothetical protein C9I92_01760 [Photobacterium ganghwense]QSV12972.1 hypothetical protein FH974_09360 [Photobacterium ganghwense]